MVPPARPSRTTQFRAGSFGDMAGAMLIGLSAGIMLSRRRAEPGREPGDTTAQETTRAKPFGQATIEAAPSKAEAPRLIQTGHGRSAPSPLSIPWRGWKDILFRTYQQISEDRLFAVAAGVVFLGLLALFPAITAIVSLYGLIADGSTANEHLRELLPVLPSGSFSIIQEQVQRVVQKSDGKLSLGFFIGLLLAIWSANAGVKAMIDSLNVVYGEHEKRGFFKLNLISLAFTFGAVMFVLLAISAVIVFPLVLETFGLSNMSEIIVAMLRWPLIALVMLGALAVLYRYGPSRRLARWQWLSVGSVFACVFWILGSVGFSVYLSNFTDYDATYGSLGAAIGLMMWMYLSAIVVLVGAELNAEIEHQTAIDTTVGQPKPMGTRGAAMADTVGKSLGEKQRPT